MRSGRSIAMRDRFRAYVLGYVAATGAFVQTLPSGLRIFLVAWSIAMLVLEPV